VDERGFIFFTNYGSRKGCEMTENPNAALTFFWPELERQVCVAGTVTRLPEAESERYFKSRPRGSQIAAWASNQSEVIPDRKYLEAKWKELEKKFPEEVPLPPDWGGFILQPERLEFWQGRPSRLHDRLSYSRQTDGGWRVQRLSP
jgi:pyridoxamine 5'-phosphate oxidase